MSVEIETARVAFAGAGSTGPFTIPFYFLANTHLSVVKLASSVETTLALTTDYTLTGAGVEAGGTLTLLVALAVGETLTITRDVPITQETNWPVADPFPASSHEDAADKLTMIVQQLDDAVGRTMRQPVSDASVIGELPIATARASKFLAFDASGDPVVAAGTSADLTPVSAFVDTLLDDADAGAVLTTLGVSAFVQTLLDDANQATANVTIGSIPQALIDAAGDILYGTAADTTGRLAIGTAGQHLAVNAGATAPEWVDGTETVVKRKTADESVTSSTTVQDDDHLTFAIGANEEWVATIEMVFGDAPGDSGLKVQLGTPSGATLRYTVSLAVSAGADAVAKSTTSSAVELGFTQAQMASSSDAVVRLAIWVLNGATPGNVQLLWAQTVSNGTALTAKKGSFLVAHRIA